jgi:hypothetical protein
MSHLAAIQIGAQLASLIVYGLLAVWFVAPWLQQLGRADALIVIAATHLFRYATLLTYPAQHDGYPISDVAAFEAVAGDVAGAVIALAAVGALRYRLSAGIALSWMLAAATLLDFAVGIRRKSLEPLWGLAAGTTWLLLNFYVTLIIVTLPVLVWQLYARRGEQLTPSAKPRP